MDRQKIPYPPRVRLAHTPTPLQPLTRLGQRLGKELYVKRDDLTGCALSGNKIRKLEFVLADALADGADWVLTCGKVQSNHARATALAAARLGLGCSLVLRTEDPENPPPPRGNHLLDCLAGARIAWVDYDRWADREEILRAQAEALRGQGRKPYIIPFGASNALGAWGEIGAMDELGQDLERLPGGAGEPLTVVTAAGTGGAMAGYLLGAARSALPARIVGMNVDDHDFILGTIGSVREEAARVYGLNPNLARGFELIDGYQGAGYALSRPREIKFIAEMARLEGLVLDPVYTGKALLGLVLEVEKNPEAFDHRVVFVHTGGIFHLFTGVEGLDRVWV